MIHKNFIRQNNKTYMRKFQTLMLFVGLFFSVAVNAQKRATIDSLVMGLGKNFVSNTVKVNGTALHYVRGGNGPAIILIHGFPQDWYEYHKIMPRLAKKFTVVAVDLRGVGESLATPTGYDAPNLAKDIHQLAEQLKLQQVYIVGHDIGGMVAYAFMRLYSKATRGVMILDVPLPGIHPWDESIAGPKFWLLNFHQTPDLPEKLVAGRQAIYFHFILDPFHISDADVAHFASAYADPEHLHAGFELYRAFPANGKFNAARRSTIDVPLVWAAGENSFFGKIGSRIAVALGEHGCSNVRSEIIKNSGHYVVNEQPDSVAALIERYASL
jgi:pimeloyl-ACP methyl ester carboxylesterase